MKQYIIIKNKDNVVKSYDIPYQVKVYYTLSRTSEQIIIRCGIGVFDTYDDSIITDIFLKNIKEDITLNPGATVEYKVDERVVSEIKTDSNTYIAYKTKMGDNGILIEELEISNYISNSI